MEIKLFQKKFIVLPFVLLSWSLLAQDYDFVKTIDGNKLYFIILTTGGTRGATVEVTFPGTEEHSWKGFRQPVGQVSIPSQVTPDPSHSRNADTEDDDTTVYTVVSIGYNAFKGCKRINRLILPSSLARIGESAFAGCDRIEYIAIAAQQPPRMDDSSFDQVSIDIPVHIPTGRFHSYKEAVGWRIFTQLTEF